MKERERHREREGEREKKRKRERKVEMKEEGWMSTSNQCTKPAREEWENDKMSAGRIAQQTEKDTEERY